MSKLVIVESPTKTKTISKYLGSDYEVVATMGHIRDLPKSKFGVDVDDNFKPLYGEIKGKENFIKDLKKQAKKSEQIFLATDPDREGEAISWHLAHILNLNLDDYNRVEFNEVTKTGIQAGMANPRKINIDLVNAQQARRILDRIVGYKLSPFLWKKVRRGLSAGRVQSVAVRVIVDRENEINKFEAKEYWSIDAKFTAPSGRKVFSSKFTGVNGKKVELNSKEQTDEILKMLENAAFMVSDVKKSIRKKSPAPPFTTSTMQQEASRRSGFQARRTMKAAQELYEGVEISGMGAVGLITYMRTDSLRISDEARSVAYDFIVEKYGKGYVPETPNSYKSKSNSQDAHEAIRPTMPSLTPEKVRADLSSDQYKLYKLIWERFTASQMSNAILDTVSVSITANTCDFKSSGYSVRFDGFTVLYEEAKDEEIEDNNELPIINKGDELKVKTLDGNQHFTQPPPRFTEASLIKTFEENGIGRPSTYAPTIATIIARLYVEREGKQLKPTPLGDVITKLMEEHFNRIVDVTFTASMENSLDEVEMGNKDWVDTLKLFYGDFDSSLKAAEIAMEGKRVKVPDEETDVICDECQKPMVIKIGRFGKFLACTGFPDCKVTKKIIYETEGACPLCGNKVLEKKTKKSRKFYGCADYPNCNFMSWYKPVLDKCPKCNSNLFKKGGKVGKLICEKPDCKYERNA